MRRQDGGSFFLENEMILYRARVGIHCVGESTDGYLEVRPMDLDTGLGCMTGITFKVSDRQPERQKRRYQEVIAMPNEQFVLCPVEVEVEKVRMEPDIHSMNNAPTGSPIKIYNIKVEPIVRGSPTCKHTGYPSGIQLLLKNVSREHQSSISVFDRLGTHERKDLHLGMQSGHRED
jgi:hypothetical protein